AAPGHAARPIRRPAGSKTRPSRRRTCRAHRPGTEHSPMTADARTTNGPAWLAAHELVLLHGQPGSPADWQPVTARLPTQLHAIAADRPGYGSSPLPAGGFAA